MNTENAPRPGQRPGWLATLRHRAPYAALSALYGAYALGLDAGLVASGAALAYAALAAF
ncbi:MAG: hypothetical protein VYD87_15420 [Pseudomonadota bacterium]|nr:hypothetical protein [Pseudomonadota bacterium]MEE3100378.1 hypothetical protein [Pseudomonadota bacterium]